MLRPRQREEGAAGVKRDSHVSLTAALLAIAPSYVLSRVLLLAITSLVAVVERNTAVSVWNRWDAHWYVGIAAHGYHWSLDGKPALAFFPLYPLLLHLGSGWGVPVEVRAMLLSNAAFAAALLYLYLFT